MKKILLKYVGPIIILVGLTGVIYLLTRGQDHEKEKTGARSGTKTPEKSAPSPAAVTGASTLTRVEDVDGSWTDWIPIPAGYHDTSTASIPQSDESGMKKEYRTQGGIKQIKYGTYFGEHATEVRYYSKQKTSFTVKFVPN